MLSKTTFTHSPGPAFPSRRHGSDDDTRLKHFAEKMKLDS